MGFRYKNREGKICSAAHAGELLQAIKRGDIAGDTAIEDESTNVIVKARDLIGPRETSPATAGAEPRKPSSVAKRAPDKAGDTPLHESKEKRRLLVHRILAFAIGFLSQFVLFNAADEDGARLLGEREGTTVVILVVVWIGIRIFAGKPSNRKKIVTAWVLSGLWTASHLMIAPALMNPTPDDLKAKLNAVGVENAKLRRNLLLTLNKTASELKPFDIPTKDLTDSQQIAAQLRKLDTFTAALDQYVSEMAKANETLKKNMDEAAKSSNPKFREDVMEGVNNVFKRRAPIFDKWVDRQRQLILMMRKQLQFFAAEVGKVSANGNDELIFDRPEALEEYNALIDKFNEALAFAKVAERDFNQAFFGASTAAGSKEPPKKP